MRPGDNGLLTFKIIIMQEIIIFLKSHPLISVNRLESRLNIPQRSIAQAMAGLRSIPKKHISAIEKELSHYGFSLSNIKEL